jgi:hypothetical protein
VRFDIFDHLIYLFNSVCHSFLKAAEQPGSFPKRSRPRR